ncbi:hypothetical protein [Burkholderia glumae]|uniref:hypothetical protein n=1 Tax=Burkholderia glumae TaxID=337 RepID=UPI000F5F6739|nr:hypothetical protein [Burkholderia glumae]
MAATNDFLAFGGGSSPNVIDQPTYAALPARLTGFQSGVAQSAQLNKVWRQSSIMAAVLAQFIVVRTGQSATDDGTTATLLNNLLASTASLNGDPTQTFSVATATASAHAVTLAQAQSMQGNMSGNLHIGSPGQLTLSQLSQNYIDYYGASGTLLLPAASTIGAGKYCKFTNFGSGVLTIQVSGSGDFLYYGVSSTVTTITLQLGDDLEIVGSGSNEIDVIGGSAVRQFFPLSIGPATAPNHAATMAQAAGVVGSMRNLAMAIATASASATLTADEVVVETALGGVRYCVANVNKTINLATTGPGGMDAGSAPASGFVGIYLIYAPATQTSALLATNTTNVLAPSIYSGTLPSGYTASALVSVWTTTSSGQFVVGKQIDRDIAVFNVGVLSTSIANSGISSFSTTSFPKNARKCKFYSSFTTSAAGTANATIYADSIGTDQSTVGITTSGAGGIAGTSEVLITVPQNIFYSLTNSGGSVTWALNLERYTI